MNKVKLPTESINASATFAWPFIAAMCRGVMPSLFVMLIRSGTLLRMHSVALHKLKKKHKHKVRKRTGPRVWDKCSRLLRTAFGIQKRTRSFQRASPAEGRWNRARSSRRNRHSRRLRAAQLFRCCCSWLHRAAQCHPNYPTNREVKPQNLWWEDSIKAI